MTEDKVVLREFAYFDRQKVEDFLSSIEDGLAREKKSITYQTSAEIEGKVKVPGIAEIGGGIGHKGMELQELKAATDASLFQRLYSHLRGNNLIRSVDVIDKKIWEGIGSGEVLEVTGEIELSAMENLFDLFRSIAPFMKSENTDEKTKMVFQVLEMTSAQGVNIKMRLGEGYKLVAIIYKDRIRVAKQELNAKYNVLCRVQRKLRANEVFNLFSLIPGVKFPEEMIQQLIKTLPSAALGFLDRSISDEDFRIKYPAMIVTPIAIYR